MLRQVIFMMVVAVCLASAGQAADVMQNDEVSEHKSKDDAPMETKMMKEGMMHGDVGKAADKSEKKIQPMLEQEEQSMQKEKVNP